MLNPKTAEANSKLDAYSYTFGSQAFNSLTENQHDVWYKLVLPSSGRVSISVKSTGLKGLNMSVESEKKELYSRYMSEDGGAISRQYDVELSKGTAYVHLSQSYYTGGFSFSASFTSAGVNHTETNNSIDTAYGIASGKLVKGHFSETNRVDFYKITLSQPGELSLKVVQEVEDFGIGIYNADYRKVAGKTLYWDNTIEIGNNTTSFYLAKGTYYLRIVNSYEGSDGSGYYLGKYRFTPTVSYAGVNHQEPASSFKTSAPITVNKTINGLIAENDSVDYYKLTLSSTTNLTVNCTFYVKEIGIRFYKASDYKEVDDTFMGAYRNDDVPLGTFKKVITLPKGTYYIRIVGNDWGDSSYYYGKYAVSFNKPIVRKSITSVSGISTRTYTGKAIKPSVTVKAGSTKLKKGTDYTVSYKNNIKPGKAQVTVTGIGRYKGTKVVYFYIKPAKEQITYMKSNARRKVTIKYKKMAGVTGYQIYYSTRKNGTYKRYSTVKGTSQSMKLTSKRTYYVKVRAYRKIGSKTLYGAFSNVKAVRVR